MSLDTINPWNLRSLDYSWPHLDLYRVRDFGVTLEIIQKHSLKYQAVVLPIEQARHAAAYKQSKLVQARTNCWYFKTHGQEHVQHVCLFYSSIGQMCGKQRTR